METMTVNSRKDFAQWAIARVQERLKFLQRFTSAALDGPARGIAFSVRTSPTRHQPD
jgi:hypothetical protein